MIAHAFRNNLTKIFGEQMFVSRCKRLIIPLQIHWSGIAASVVGNHKAEFSDGLNIPNDLQAVLRQVVVGV